MRMDGWNNDKIHYRQTNLRECLEKHMRRKLPLKPCKAQLYFSLYWGLPKAFMKQDRGL